MMQWKDKNTISIHLPNAWRMICLSMPVSGSCVTKTWPSKEWTRVSTRGASCGSATSSGITHIGKWHGNMREIDVDVPPAQGGKERGGYVVLVSRMLGTPLHGGRQNHRYPVVEDLKEDAEKRARARSAAEGKLKALPSEKAPVKRRAGTSIDQSAFVIKLSITRLMPPFSKAMSGLWPSICTIAPRPKLFMDDLIRLGIPADRLTRIGFDSTRRPTPSTTFVRRSAVISKAR